MSVMIVTSLGDIVIDLFTEKCPLTCKNFLKLCKIKYYNGCLFHTVQKDFTAQTGDPAGTGAGGDSIYKFLYGDQARFFSDEIHLDLKHSKTGTVAMASAGENLNASQFYFTLRDGLDYLDGKHTVFGEVAEGLETLTRINEAYVDTKNRPFKNIRIKHTYILDDPFDDPPQLTELIPDASPEGKPKQEVEDEVRLEDDWVPMDEQLGPAELEEVLRAKDAHSSAVVLESIGDIPDAEMKPPDNVLFVCKLNPVTEDEDLHTIFSRFGTVISAEIIRDFKTGDSLCYAFIEFETKESCEQAYFKMDNALIDDRRIHVDFSQSVAKQWAEYRRRGGQMGKERGCFKCGAPDHTAKDCTGGPPTKQLQPPKYVLKDDNMQHGGKNNSRYEMVFDGDTPESPRQEKRNGRHDPEREKMHRRSLEDLKHGAEEKKYQGDGHRQRDRNRGHREDDRHHEKKPSRYPEERTDRRKERDDDRRDDRDYWNRSADVEGRGDGRENEGYRKRTADYDSRRGELRDGSNYKRRYIDGDKQDSRDESSHRNYDGHQGRREGQEHRRRGSASVDQEHDRERRHRSDRRR
ncbi:peptidyl-prolyl cis-trans isomerase CYP59 [Ricinus communis]|uniref:peptidyl-prolyl cis-trans isomerase CYP59 n=1 Tax=Ricinus communis TaxID=3988 RepID=UPI00077216D0|nr:peptidyl-prolyl cis-trans isomerase CYP59 [Ricinus communis]|eukprot:XP_015571371.1 peptidyl-prolyl cis-trans isomerase CYP59 [Ricinus communis]